MRIDDIWRLGFLAVGLAAILAAAGAVLAPFFAPIVLATIFVLTTWPAFAWLRMRLGGRATIAAGLMVAGLAALFIAPLVLIGGSLAGDLMDVRARLQGFQGPIGPPEALTTVPWVGPWLASMWPQDTAALRDLLSQNGEALSGLLLDVAGAAAAGVVDLGMALLIAFFFFRGGDAWAAGTRALVDRLTGPQGAHLLEVAWKTTVGVVYGVLGAAVAQGVLAGLGYAVVGLPSPALLGFVSFCAALLPMGTMVVWGPAGLWLLATGQVLPGLALLAWGGVVGSVDNLIRPYFIGRGADLPFLLVLLGVIGGIVAFGFLGLFLGPVVLALVYTLVREGGQSLTPQVRPSP
jgi:predicted PurR-regulated permease PerM